MKGIHLVCVGLLIGGAAAAEEIVLFQASQAGADTWSWGNARIEDAMGRLIVTEQNKTADYGDAYLSDRFPFFPDGQVRVRIGKVISGTCTLQLLEFKGAGYVGAMDLINSVKEPVKQEIALGGLNIPPEVTHITFKVWVGGVEGASSELAELAYVIDVPEEKILSRETFSDVSKWPAENVALTALPAGGARAVVNADASVGSILNTARHVRRPEDRLMLKLGEVKYGDVTLQLPVFDANGAYLSSVDVIKQAGPGWHSVPLGRVAWPEGAEQFEIKIWIGGNPGASAELQRLLVCKP